MTNRLGRVAVALVAGAVLVFPAPSHPGVAGGVEVEEQEALVKSAGAAAGACGVERWGVKTGTDVDAGLVSTRFPVTASIAQLRSLSAPTSLPASNRVMPTELTTYSVDATLYEYKFESDSDYHLVLQDAAGSTIIAEIPDPACVGAGSPFTSAIGGARASFDSNLAATTSFQTASVPVHLTGVGFFDYLHGQTGVAPNGFELHPVLSLTFGAAGPPGSNGAAYHAISPVRVLDTRGGAGPLGAGESRALQVGGTSGIPPAATAVVMNVTATDTTADGYLTVYPGGVARPLASNLNWSAGQTVPNLVAVSLGALGGVSIYNSSGSTDVIADVEGWLAPEPAGSTDGLYNPLVPARLLDTRDGTGVSPAAPLGPSSGFSLQVAGRGGVPAAGAAAVVMNVTVTNPTSPSFLTVYPGGGGLPNSSNLNFLASQTVPNRVIVQLGPGGTVAFYNFLGLVDVIADVAGWFTDATPGQTGSTFTGLAPNRLLDTRDGTGGFSGQLGPGGAVSLQVAGRGGVPTGSGASQPGAVVLNVTSTGATAGSYLTAWPDQSPQPLASDLNYQPGVTVANLVVTALGPDGKVNLYNSGGCASVIVDVVGWFSGPPPIPSVVTSTPPVIPCPPPPTPQPRPPPQPQPQPTPPPVTPPSALTVTITQSQYGFVGATTSPGATCNAQAVLPSGRISTASGLQGPRIADSGGNVSWSYNTVSTTSPGIGTHTVSCSLNGASAQASAPFTV